MQKTLKRTLSLVNTQTYTQPCFDCFNGHGAVYCCAAVRRRGGNGR